MQFRLRTLFLVFFVMASAFAAFGPAGFLIAPWLAALVMSIRIAIAWRSTTAFLVACALALPVCPCFLPGVSSARAAARRVVCANNLRQIGFALQNYHSAYGCFPPAFVADAQGRPMHSWRVLILPFLEEQDLYDKYRFDEPWDGPHNRTLAASMSGVFRCPSQPVEANPSATSYVAIVGPGTAWPGDTGIGLGQINDPANTILLVEVDGSDFHWMQPRDLAIDEVLADVDGLAGAITTRHNVSEEYFRVVRRGQSGYVLLADGSIHYLSGRVLPETLADLLRIDGPKPVDFDDVEGQPDPPPVVERIRWDNVVGLPLFVISFLLLVSRPLPKRPSRNTGGQAPSH
ncbi:MAG: DUF1559 domain-containing protein [Pirellulales bacterium]|nr:DUF1559 domain-containing protein [Pirellulales bacterium]